MNTVSVAIDLNAYLGLLAVDGTLVNVGAPAEPLSVHVMSLIGGRRSFAGSMIGGIALTQEMLDFCAEHDIAAEVEVITADQVNEARRRHQRGKRWVGEAGCSKMTAEQRTKLRITRKLPARNACNAQDQRVTISDHQA